MSLNPGRKKLPVNPSLEHLQKQAKRLVKQHPDLQLAAAQHQIAQSYGFKNWADLARVVAVMSGAERPANGARYNPLPAAARAGVGSGDFTELRRLLRETEFTRLDLDQSLAHLMWYGKDATWAARKQMADELRAHGADPDGQYGGGGYGPIIFGTGECLQPDAMQYLIEAGADVTAEPVETKYGRQCILTYVLGTYGRGSNERKHRCLEILLQHRAYVPPQLHPAVLAIHRGDLEGLDTALAADPTLVNRRFADLSFGNISLAGATLLHCAAEHGEAGALLLLLLRGADINAAADVINGVGGQTPVFHAIGCAVDGDASSLEMLLPRMPNFGAADSGSALFKRPYESLAALMQREPVLRREPALFRLVAEAINQLDVTIWAQVRRHGEVVPAGTAVGFARQLAESTDATTRSRAEAVVEALRAPLLSIFTVRALKAIQQATEEARQRGHNEVDAAHLFCVLLRFSKGTALDLLRELGTNPDALRDALAVELPPGDGYHPALGRSIHSQTFKAVLRTMAEKKRRGAGGPKIDSAELLIAIASLSDGPVAKVLRAAGIDRHRVLVARAKTILPPGP